MYVSLLEASRGAETSSLARSKVSLLEVKYGTKGNPSNLQSASQIIVEHLLPRGWGDKNHLPSLREMDTQEGRVVHTVAILFCHS